MEISFYKKWSFYVPVLLHSIFILCLTVYTITFLNSAVIPVYLIFSSVFLLSTLFSLSNILRFRTGVFYYLLNMMFLLGFWFKFSVQKITSLSYREPIGTFVFTPESETRVLWVIICGIGGFIFAQVCSYYFFEKEKIEPEVKQRFQLKPFVIIFFLTIVLAFFNFKYNILMFGLKPSLVLPLKGNAVYFLALTRATIFLFFFYCFRTYSNKMLYWGALIASISSIGVASRMVVIIYFAVIFILILQQMRLWNLKNLFGNILLVTFAFGCFSFSTVFLSTSLRNIFIYHPSEIATTVLQSIPMVVKNVDETTPNINSTIVPDDQPRYFDVKQEARNYKDLVLGRWVGIEGVMAVEAYPQKSLAFLWEALHEESYRGRSFYTRISNPKVSMAPSSSDIYSTSVPGPIAFFYYSGSLFFVSLAILVSTFFLSFCERIVFKYYNKNKSVGIFVSTFLVADFFQFGISPIAYLRYLSFSLFCVAVFYYLVEYKKFRI